MQNVEIERIRKKIIDHINLRKNTPVVLHSEARDILTENYTINFFPNLKEENMILECIELFKSKYPSQNFIEDKNIHSTLMGMISINSPIEFLVNFIRENIPSNPKFNYQGMDTSRSAVSILSTPVNFNIRHLRDLFSKNNYALQYNGIYTDICWTNFMRFKHKPKKSLYSDILSNIDNNFGTVSGKVQLLKNSSRLLTNSEVVFEL